MLAGFSEFAKQIMGSGNFQVGKISRTLYQELLTGFQALLKQDVVILEGFVDAIRNIPGRLIIDDTTNPKYGLKQWTRKLKIVGTSGYAQGYKVLLFLWECREGRIPLAFALWHQQSKPVTELVLQGFSLLRNQEHLKPEAVFFLNRQNIKALTRLRLALCDAF